MSNVFSINLPRLIGSRESSVALLESLPSNLANSEIIIDGSQLLSASQGSVDELCKQLCEMRNAESVTFVTVSERFLSHAATSFRLRNFKAFKVLP